MKENKQKKYMIYCDFYLTNIYFNTSQIIKLSILFQFGLFLSFDAKTTIFNE